MTEEDPIDLAVQTLAEMHAENLRAVPSAQLGIERVTDSLGKPWFAWAAILFVIVWIGLNLAVAATSPQRALDRPQFPWLELIVSLTSLLMTIFILITQNRQDLLSHRRAEITLHLALVSEQKVAKIIELLEQLRRDDPNLPNRNDPIAAKMAQGTDLREVAGTLERAEEVAQNGENDPVGEPHA